MQSLINKFSSGKIEIKFKLIESVLKDKKRKRISNIVVFSSVFFYFLMLPWIFVAIGITSNVFIYIVIILFFISLEVFTRIWLLQTKETGLIKFLPDKIEVINYKREEYIIINYVDILAIRYVINVPRSIVQRHPGIKSYNVKLILKNGDPEYFQIENKIFYTEDDKKEFRSFDPDLIKVLENINPKYGCERIDKFKIKVPEDFK